MILDLALLVLLGLAGWLGFRKSAFRFVLPLLEWVIGVYLLMKLTPPVLRLIHGLLNPEPRMAFLFTFIVLGLAIYYAAYKVNLFAAGYFEGRGGGLTGNIVKGATAVLLTLLITGWVLNALDRQDWLPPGTREQSRSYPVLRAVSKGTGFVSGEFANAFEQYSRTIGEAFRPPPAQPASVPAE